jgi:hypothetical protein
MLRDLSKLIDDEDSEGGNGDQLQKDCARRRSSFGAPSSSMKTTGA